MLVEARDGARNTTGGGAAHAQLSWAFITNINVRAHTHTHAHSHTHAHTHMYTCTHTHAHSHTQALTHTHARSHTHIHSHTGTLTHMYTCTLTHSHTCTHTHTHARSHTLTRTLTHRHSLSHTHACSHTHIHTHTHTHRHSVSHTHSLPTTLPLFSSSPVMEAQRRPDSHFMDANAEVEWDPPPRQLSTPGPTRPQSPLTHWGTPFAGKARLSRFAGFTLRRKREAITAVTRAEVQPRRPSNRP